MRKFFSILATLIFAASAYGQMTLGSPTTTVTAVFTVTVVDVSSGSGSVSTSDGGISACTSTCSATYNTGTSISLTATAGGSSTVSLSNGTDGASVCSGTSSTCLFTITGTAGLTVIFTGAGSSTIPAAPTFGLDYNGNGTSGCPVSNFPSSVNHGIGRFWDTTGVEWSFVETSSGVYNWTTVDALLCTMNSNSVKDAQVALARTPTFHSSNPTDTTCSYSSGTGAQGPGQCDAPSDLNANGTGANLFWRNWVGAYAAHVNAPGYTNTHAHVSDWEIWNEPDTPQFFGGNSPSTQGTFDQLIRMEEDAYCIIKGGSFTNDYTGETCGQVRATVTSVASCCNGSNGPADTTANVVMPSYHGGSASLVLAACFLYGTGASGGNCQGRPMHHAGAGSTYTDAMNWHMKPGANVESQIDSWWTAIQAILSVGDQAKPFFNTEGGYIGCGWGGSSTCNPTDPPYTIPAMQAAYMGRFFTYNIYKGIKNVVWYNWSAKQNGTGSAQSDQAVSTTYNWLVGATVPSCSVGSDGVHSPNSLWTCTTTIAGGTSAQIMYNVNAAFYCSTSSCPTQNQTVSSGFTKWTDIGGTQHTISSHQVPVGISPVLVQ